MRDLEVVRLLPGEGARVMWLEDARFDPATAREPHRHDFHELIWVREGSGHHLIDGRQVPVRPRTVTVIGRHQVHVFARGERVHAAVVRFAEEVVHGGGAERWLLAGAADRTVGVPPGEASHLEALIRTLDAESRRPLDPFGLDAQRHLVSLLLLWVERWYDGTRVERPAADDEAVELHRRFTRRLEQDFARHHHAGHYADALRLPAAALSRALVQATGRTTKELVLDRVMLEAARLLRFTGLSISEIAHRVGFEDPLYFSRAFKRHHGMAPSAYRAKVHPSGGSAHGDRGPARPS